MHLYNLMLVTVRTQLPTINIFLSIITEKNVFHNTEVSYRCRCLHAVTDYILYLLNDELILFSLFKMAWSGIAFIQNI